MRDLDDYTEHYINDKFERYQVEYRRKKITEILEQYEPRRIVEIGCGMEPLFMHMTRDFDRYVVVEPSREFCDNAVQLSLTDERVEIKNMFFEATPELCSERWDFVVCSGLLHEVEEPASLLQHIKKICCADTIVHINVPNAMSVHRLIAKCMGITENLYMPSERNIRFQQHTIFDKKLLMEMVSEAGFQVFQQGSYFVKPFTHEQMQKMLDGQIITESVLDGLYRLTEYMPEYGSEIFVNCCINVEQR